MPDDQPTTPDPAARAWSRSIHFARKLAEALADLDAAGGPSPVVRRLRDGSIERAGRALAACRMALDGTFRTFRGVARARAATRHRPAAPANRPLPADPPINPT